MFNRFFSLSAVALLLPGVVSAESLSLETMKTRMGGCFLVDYSFKETESLKSGYEMDKRVYDVNADKSVYEYILPVQKSPTELRLQHFLFSKDLSGQFQFVMKHQAEDWQMQPANIFRFLAPGRWRKDLLQTSDDSYMVRKITNLDDGLRHQCGASWSTGRENPEWACDNFAPIPGRETRDMGRRDYNTLDRSTRIILYSGDSWSKRQNNVKTILGTDGGRTPLAREFGKTWWVRVPSSQCKEAAEFASARAAFHGVLMNAWEKVFASARDKYSEIPLFEGKSRYSEIMALEEKYFEALARDSSLAPQVEAEILSVLRHFERP